MIWHKVKVFKKHCENNTDLERMEEGKSMQNKTKEIESFQVSWNAKESACNSRDQGSIPGLGRSPGEGSSSPLQYSCLEDPMDRRTWWSIVHGVAKSCTWLSNYRFHFFFNLDIKLANNKNYHCITYKALLYIIIKFGSRCCYYCPISWKMKLKLKDIWQPTQGHCTYTTGAYVIKFSVCYQILRRLS